MKIKLTVTADEEIADVINKVLEEQEEKQRSLEAEEMERISVFLASLRSKGWAIIAISPSSLKENDPETLEKSLRNFISTNLSIQEFS